VKNYSTTPRATLCQLALRRSCAQELHAGGTAHCEIQQSDLHPVIYVDEGIVIVNDRRVRLSLDDGTYVHIRGTYVITFTESATVNETRFVSHDTAQRRAPGVASSPSRRVNQVNC